MAKKKTLTLTGADLTAEEVVLFGNEKNYTVALSPAALARARRSRALLAKESAKRVLYGVNTGFGPMASRLIGKGSLAELQLNLVRSHASGAGEPLPERYVRAAMLIRLNTLLKGYSGVSDELLFRLAAFLNAGIAPVVPEHGGVGASGDLVQLAHIALGLIGEGEVSWNEKRMPAKDALKRANLAPYMLKEKEGLALINGTSLMSAVACFVAADAQRLLSTALRAGALALEAVHGFDDALAPALHAARPHAGQRKAAMLMRGLIKNSRLVRSRASFEHAHALAAETRDMAESAQDVYSLRCTPQLVGPMLDALAGAQEVLAIEINSATDNPLIDVSTKQFLHGGNFHGEYVAVAMDRLKLALAKLSLLSERRLNYFLHAEVNKRFPPFLTLGVPGLSLGLQGLQFTATSTVAQNQSIAFPHSLHSIPSNGDNQDVVSMGADAALFAARVADNTAIVLAIELLALSQAIAAAKEEKLLSPQGKKMLTRIRQSAPIVTQDRPLSGDITKLAALVRGEEFELGV